MMPPSSAHRCSAYRAVASLLMLSLLLTGTACGHSSSDATVLTADQTVRQEKERLHRAVLQLDELAAEMMRRSGVPGMAVAVVKGDKMLYSKGFGVRQVGGTEKVNPDTVFALASMSKPLGATAIARQVTLGSVNWSTPIREVFPWFALADPTATAQVTVGDMYAHRSGLPNHAGDTLEELDFDRETILRCLNQLPLSPFRQKFDYTNYGMTTAATAVATLAGTDWPTLTEETLYRPLGMTSTSSRFADFLARPNRAPGMSKKAASSFSAPNGRRAAESSGGRRLGTPTASHLPGAPAHRSTIWRAGYPLC